MIHFDEMACLLYLEGQLDDARARELVAHTEECATCRTLLNALKRESQFLATALTEENESMPARLLGARQWAMPSWVWTLAFGIFAAGAYWLWTDGVSPWLDQLSNAGFGGTDLMSMILFTGAFWEGWGDMVDTIQIAALIVVLVGAVVLIRRRLRRPASIAGATIAVVMSALLFTLAVPQPAAAADVRRGRAVSIPATETIHNDLIVAGPSVRVDGTVEGDLIVFTRDLNVTGHVTGDVIALAREVIIDGKVDGNVRTFSQTATFQGTIGKNVSAFASSIDLTPKGNVGGGLIAIVGEADLDGKIQRDLLGIIGRSDVDGPIGGEMWIRGGTLSVASTAVIGGSARFEGREQPVIAAGAKFASPLQVEISEEVRRSRFSVVRLALHEIFSYGAALLVGILLVTVFPGFFQATLREARNIGLPIGIGALAFISGFFLLILGVLLLFVGVGAGIAGILSYAPIVYVSQVFVGAWLGIRILGESPANTNTMIGRMAVGLLILHVIGLIPFLGALVWLAVRLWGTGAVLMGFYRMSRVESVAVPA